MSTDLSAIRRARNAAMARSEATQAEVRDISARLAVAVNARPGEVNREEVDRLLAQGKELGDRWGAELREVFDLMRQTDEAMGRT